jgi:carboxymethylenebutenolidase
MSETIQLKAKDGHELDAYVAKPEGEPIAGLVVIQEIFGVNKHIRSVADGYAKDGFLVIAPALFDRVEKHVELTYEGEDMKKAVELMQKLKPDTAIEDVGAALDYVKTQTQKKSGTIGYCYGGSMSWLSACRLTPDASVGYYAGGIGNFAQETPKAPVMLHFGRLDTHIPAEQVEKVHELHPEVQIFWYDNAEHGFNCDMRSSFNAQAAKLARQRSLEFLKQNLA